jgi:hypothetical protein
MKGLSVLAISSACSISLSFLATAQPTSAVPESGSNNSFTTRDFLPSGSNTVDGELSFNSVDYFTFSGLDPGSLFTAQINSDVVDPLLGLLDDSGNILTINNIPTINDDKADNSVLSLLTGKVPESGIVNFGVSGLRDIDLAGNHFESGSYSLSLNTIPFPTPSTNPTLLNGGFETGDFTGWTTLGETSIETSAFGSGPTQGTSQASLSTAGAAFAGSIIEEFLGLEIGSLTNFGIPLDPFRLPNGDPFPGGVATQGSAIRQTFTANAGDILTFDWNFLTNETALFPPLNDFSFVSISSLQDLAGALDQRFQPVISPMTQLFQETGFQPFSFTIPTTGTYTLGIGVTDWRDTTKDSVLLVDNVQIASVPEPTSALAVLGFGAFLGVGSVFKRKHR